MNHASLQSSIDPAPPALPLPRDRRDWPHEARTAYHALLRELDTWCRCHGWPPSRNAAVAEEAVRQVW